MEASELSVGPSLPALHPGVSGAAPLPSLEDNRAAEQEQEVLRGGGRRRSRSPDESDLGAASADTMRKRMRAQGKPARAHVLGAEDECKGRTAGEEESGSEGEGTKARSPPGGAQLQQHGVYQQWESPPQPPLPPSRNPPARLASEITPAACLAALASLSAAELSAAAGSDVHAAASTLTGMAGIATPSVAVQPASGAAHQHHQGAVRDQFLCLGQRILSLYKQHHHAQQAQHTQQAPARQASRQVEHLARQLQQEQLLEQQQGHSSPSSEQQQQRRPQPPTLPSQPQPPTLPSQPQPPAPPPLQPLQQPQLAVLQPLRPSTPLQQPGCGAAAAGGTLEDMYRSRIARYEAELSAMHCQLASTQRQLMLQEGARAALTAELDWAREAARGAQIQRGAMEVLMAKNTELQEQVRQLSTRQHMVQQQLVAAMAARERRHAEAQQLTADGEGLRVQLAEAGSRQRALHQQVAALESRALRAEQELEGVRAARDWLAPQLEAALAGQAALREELRCMQRAMLDGGLALLGARPSAASTGRVSPLGMLVPGAGGPPPPPPGPGGSGC